MSLYDDLKLAFKFRKFERTVHKKGQNPLVELFGYEKSYGKAQPNDFQSMVNNYQSWAYACINRNAYSVAKTELELYKRTITNKGADYTEIYDHPFLDLMKTVNPFFNRFELWVLTVTFLDLTGNAYWWLVKDALGVPRAIWNIPSPWIKIVPSKTNFIDGYIMKQPESREQVPFDESEIIHFKYPSPFSLFYGCSPMYAAAYDVDINRELKAHGVNFLMNSAQPAGLLTTENSLNDREYERLKTMWNMKYRGSENAGKLAILEAGLKYEKTGSNLAELQFTDTSRGVRDAILAIFGVPASQLGLVEDVNRANAEANEYVYQSGTILPKLKLIEEKLNEKLMPIYDKNLVCEFSNPVPQDKEFRLREQQTHIASGYSSIDDERIEDGRDPYDTPETSAPLIPFSVTPAGTERENTTGDPLGEPAGTDPEEPADDMEDDAEDTEKAYKAYGGLYDTKSKRDHKWETFVSLTTPQESVFKSAMRRFFEAQRRIVNDNLNKLKSYPVKAGVEANILFPMNQENERLKIILKPLVLRAVKAGAKLGYTELNNPIDFNLLEPNILRSVENRLAYLAENVNTQTAKIIKENIDAVYAEFAEGILQGAPISEIAKRINTVFDYSEKFRTTRIARTEVIGAANEGQLLSYKENGVEEKEWITARDEKVRDSHQIDGQIVGITENFTLNDGEQLQKPGDRGASVGNIVNCRCCVAPIVRRND